MIKEQDKKEMMADNIQEAYKSMEGRKELTEKLESKYNKVAMAWNIAALYCGVKSAIVLGEIAHTSLQSGFESVQSPALGLAWGATLVAAAVGNNFTANNVKKDKKNISSFIDSIAESIERAFKNKNYDLVEMINKKATGFLNDHNANEIGAKIKSKKENSGYGVVGANTKKSSYSS